MRVTVRSAVIGPVELAGPNGVKRTPKDPLLVVTLRISNEGVERRISLSGWAVGEGGATFSDKAGAVYKPKSFEAGWEIIGRVPPLPGVFPGKAQDVMLTFEPPDGRTGGLKLELSGAGVGVPDAIRFTLPDVFIKVRRPQNRP